MYDRWYSERVRAKSLFDKLRPGFEGANVSFKNVRLWVGGVMGIIAGLFLFLAIMVTLGQNSEKGVQNQPPNYRGLLMIAGLGVGLSATGGLLTWFVVGSGNRQLKNRLFSFDDATKKYDIKSCGNYELQEDYGVPLFHSIDMAGCPGKTLSAWLCGKWKGDEFAWLQGGQLVDPLLRTIGDSAALNLASLALFGAKGKRANRLRRAGFDAVVFSEELALPDIALGHRHIIETSYTKKALKDVAQPLPGIPVSNLMLWGAVSDSRGGAGVYSALADIVNSKQCLIQVIGGRVVVFLNSFVGFQSQLVNSLEDVERELDVAHTIFQRLKIVAQSKDPSISAPIDANVVAEAFKPHCVRRVSKGKIFAGICLLLFGGMGALGAIGAQEMSKREAQQKDLPKVAEQDNRVEVKVNKAGITRGQDSDGEPGAQPWIEYTYMMYGQQYKRKSALTKDPDFLPLDDANAMLAQYRKGMKIKAWYDPASPGKSSLIEKVVQAPPVQTVQKKEVDLGSAFTLAGLMGIAGLGLVIFGFIGSKPKAVVPDFSNSETELSPEPECDNPSIVSAPVEEAEPEWSNLSSAKYFNQNPAGMLD